MRFIKNNLSFVALIALLFIVFRSYFTTDLLISSDLLYNYRSTMLDLSTQPYLWHLERGSGLGGPYSFLLWEHFLKVVPTVLLSNLGLGWEIIERLIFFYPFLFISTISSFIFSRNLGLSKNFSLLSVGIFTLNPFILMIVGGGQLQIGLAYSLAPLVLTFFLKVIENFSKNNLLNLRNSLLAGILISIDAMFDIRIAFIVFTVLLTYFIVNLFLTNHPRAYIVNLGAYFLAIPVFISFLIHFYWIFPFLLIGENPIAILGDAYGSVRAVNFLSFARLENSISLLHPYWPENIFGKINFMKPEFLLIPMLAFISLLFVKNESKLSIKRLVISLSLIALGGAFLAKGSSEPLGGIYLLLFNHVPGFNLFRDPIKWYLITSLSYGVLIPYSVSKIYGLITTSDTLRKYKNLKLNYVFLIAIFIYLLFLISPALLGKLSGTFTSQVVPSDYLKLESLISKDRDFYRTFWIPSYEQYSYYSYSHPLILANEFLNTPDLQEIIRKTKNDEFQKELDESSIKYVIVPLDTQGKIFLTDRRYDEEKFIETVEQISKVPGLTRVKGFDKLAVFQREGFKDHFWTPSKELSVSYEYINPTSYVVHLKNARSRDQLIFSETFNPGWILDDGSSQILSRAYDKRFNSFELNKTGDYSVKVVYKYQRLLSMGLIISFISLVSISLVIISVFGKRKGLVFASRNGKIGL